MKKIGYALSGGGARGFAHLGMIKYLEELGIKPSVISGTSAGAIVGAFYATGKSPEEIHAIMRNARYFGWNNVTFKKTGIFSMDKLREVLLKLVPENDFSALKIKLHTVSTDIKNGKSVTFSEGELATAVIASASIPVVFQPVEKADQILIDGGLLNNFPVEPLMQECDFIIGSHLNKLDDGITDQVTKKPFQLTERCFHLAIAGTVYPKTHLCDVFIDHDLNHFSIYDLKKADQIFEEGYKSAKSHRTELLQLLENAND